ncbi:hypothetical protein TSUD_62060 [Trifolium subterraneum]|uniref:WW domain-containing protein n=1 Tax=Trifolium subterraneum TaxID=3900 RepID=A0A2Z6P3J7_TRISU|nr:hypothetical protein TSUD_62060 [Trifolium subterraneum]
MAQPPLSAQTPPSMPNSSSTPASSPAPPISYAVNQNLNASGNSHHPPSHSGMKPNSAPIQPPLHNLPPRAAASPSFSYNFPQSASPFADNQHAQSNTNMSDSVTQDFSKVSSASGNLHPAPAPTSISSMPPPSDPNYRPTTSWMPTAPTFPVHPVMPGTPGPPGLAKPVYPAAQSASTDFSSGAVLRQNMPTVPIASDPNASHRGLPYPPIPSMVAPPQGYWLQPPQMSGALRPPFNQYPASFPGPFPFPARGVALPAVPVPDSQPPGVTPVGAASISAPSAPGHLLRGTSGVQMEVISAHTDDKHKSNTIVTQNEDVANDQLDAWTAHKTESGIVYYYNALTGKSTYDKPLGFKAEAHQVSVQPTPVSMVDLPGTDWQLVSTSDGKKYYYNNRTKV